MGRYALHKSNLNCRSIEVGEIEYIIDIVEAFCTNIKSLDKYQKLDFLNLRRDFNINYLLKVNYEIFRHGLQVNNFYS